MENKGQLIAMDIYQHKLVELKKRAKELVPLTFRPMLLETAKPIKSSMEPQTVFL